MNPLCVRVEPPVLKRFFCHNRNWSKKIFEIYSRKFGVDCLTLTLNPKVSRLMYRRGFVRDGIPN